METVKLKERIIERELLKGIDCSDKITSCNHIGILKYLENNSDVAFENIEDISGFVYYHFSNRRVKDKDIIIEILEKGLDPSSLLTLKCNSNQFLSLSRWFRDGVDLTPYYSKKFTSLQLNEIAFGLRSGVDVSIYAKDCFNLGQMDEIRSGLVHRVDISIYAYPHFDDSQMQIIRVGLERGLDAKIYAKPGFSYTQMIIILDAMESGLDPKELGYLDRQMTEEEEIRLFNGII